jgi:RNA polymerase sigma-70 factor, ECF subfamily
MNGPQALLSPSRPREGENSPPAAEEVFREYAPHIYSLARRMLDNDSAAEDVTAEVLVRVVHELDTFRAEPSPVAWLDGITLSAARRRQTTMPVENVLGVDVSSGPAAGRDRELWHLIEAAAATLPVPYREVFLLSDVEGLSGTEVAQRLGLSVPVVESWLHRARLMMRHALAPHFGETPA